MDAEEVLQPLLERFHMEVESKRALGCTSKYHAAKVRDCFAQCRIYVSSADCTYWNARFLLHLVHLALKPGTFPMRNVPVLCVEGETRMPEMPLDQFHWQQRCKEPINVDMLQRATVYFLSRAVASVPDFKWTTNCKPSFNVKNSDICDAPEKVYRLTNVVPGPNMGDNIYAAMSGVHEFHVLHTKLGWNAAERSATAEFPPLEINWHDKLDEVEVAWRLLDDDAAREIGQRILKLNDLKFLTLEGTTPCYSTFSISQRVLFGSEKFWNLQELDLCNNPLGSSAYTMFNLSHALGHGRLPVLQNLFLMKTGIGQRDMEELAPALGQVRQQLKCLWIGGNPIGWVGLSRLMQQSFAGAAALEELRVDDIGCETVHYESLAKYVKGGELPFIVTLEIGGSVTNHPRAHKAILRALECAQAERRWKNFCAEECHTKPLGFDPKLGLL